MSNVRNPFNVGIVGAGRIADIHARTLAALEDVRLIGVADVMPARAEEFAHRFGTVAVSTVEALLELPQLDAVVLCTPTKFHAAQTILAAQAGKHVLCEKPMALTLAAADRMIAAADAAGVILMVGHIVHFMADYLEARRVLREGAIGPIHTVHSARYSGLAGASWQGWLQGADLGLGAFEAQIHDLDFLIWTLGWPQAISSRGWRGTQGGWAHVMSWLDYDDGRWATAEGGLAMPATYPFTAVLRAFGDGGVLEYQFRAASYAEQAAGRLLVYPEHGDVQDVTPAPTDPFLAELEYFVACARSGRQPQAGGARQARSVLAAVLAARQSLEEEGQRINMASL